MVAVVSYALIRLIVRRATIGRPPLPPLAAFGDFGTPWGDVVFIPDEMRPARMNSGGGESEQRGLAGTGLVAHHDKQAPTA